MNFELIFLLNLIDVWKKVIKKEPSDLDKRKKILNITKVGRKINIHEKKVKGKRACCFGSKFIL